MTRPKTKQDKPKETEEERRARLLRQLDSARIAREKKMEVKKKLGLPLVKKNNGEGVLTPEQKLLIQQELLKPQNEVLADTANPNDKMNVGDYLKYENAQIEKKIVEVNAENKQLEKQAQALEKQGIDASSIRKEIEDNLKNAINNQTDMLKEFLVEMRKQKTPAPAEQVEKPAPAPTPVESLSDKMYKLFA